MARILIVDQDTSQNSALQTTLARSGHEVHSATRGEDALAWLAHHATDLVLCATELPDHQGIELFEQLHRMACQPEVVLMANFGTGQQVRDALVAGAGDFLIKPLNLATLQEVVDRVLAHRRLIQENLRLEQMVVLYQLSDRLNGDLEPERVLQVTLQGALALTGGRGCRVVLRFEDGTEETSLAGEIPATGTVEEAGGLEVPLVAGDLRIGVLAVLPTPGRGPLDEGHRKALTMLASRAASAFENARLYHRLGLFFRETVEAFTAALEAKDPYTKGHSDRVRVYARLLAEAQQLPSSHVRQIEHAAALHDIGKLGVPQGALNSRDPLTGAQIGDLLDHPARGALILGRVTLLQPLVAAVRHHHERWDGQGYPDGLAGEAIPLAARILTVVDSYDAMTTHRPYRQALLHQDALAELRRAAGTQFDPQLVERFIEALDSFRQACRQAGQWLPE